MASPYQVEKHPQKQFIIDALLAGKPVRTIAEGIHPPLDHNAIYRYKIRVMKPLLERAELLTAPVPRAHAVVPMSRDTAATQLVTQAIQDAPQASLFRSRLEKLHGRIERTLDKAETAVRVTYDKKGNEVAMAEDLSIMSPLINQSHKNLELLGRATGELEPVSTHGPTIQIICPQAAESQPRISYSSADEIEGHESGGLLEDIGAVQRQGN